MIEKISENLAHAPLGKQTIYPTYYQPDLLFAIPRATNRANLGVSEPLPFSGCDVWNAYELSWLNGKGKPQIAYAQFSFPCESPKLIESKSFKLYLNSFNHTTIDSVDDVKNFLVHDLSQAAGAKVNVKIFPEANISVSQFAGLCLDDLDVDCDIYSPHPQYLTTIEEEVSEIVFSDLLKSNCPITGQPDWASIQIAYRGKKIQHENLLKYIISYRNHEKFHEDCIERIFMDITERCAPLQLCIHARYTRRGGLDINPYRASHACDMSHAAKLDNIRLWRQ